MSTEAVTVVESPIDLIIKVIGIYCRILELHLKAVSEGGNPYQSALSKSVRLATEGMEMELEFLTFLRMNMHTVDA